ncbi:hypothetical protein F4810DRAFT_685562 [Camillea tinctor]|nr:hypothetical protein F4810DRAFT_685562 [Camillea tinctor]
MSEPEADTRPPWARIAFPPGWSSDRVQALTLSDFGQLPDEERTSLWTAISKFPSSSEFTKFFELRQDFRKANERPPTPPSYVPSGWTVNQARGLDLNLISKLPEEERRLWAAGQVADTARIAQKCNQLPTSPPSYIPAGWTTEQAICPSFELLSQLPGEDLNRFIQARNEATQLQISASIAPKTAEESPSPLVLTLQREGFPPWGFVMVRTYYRSDSRWEQFLEKFDAACDAQLSHETGDGLDKIKEMLEFKMIEDPRLEDASLDEARIHFQYAKSEGGVAAGLEMSVLLLVDAGVVNSVLSDDKDDSSAPYVVSVDVTEVGESEGYPGHFKVSIDSLLCELYPKLCMSLSPRSLWAMMDDADGTWTGDDV